ncbi:hypothetical protein GCM10011487_44720 [Steroidobacter agaridevorans]|uniref:Uncharacterized protein n=1 Tax=Steroidobacter agaridevorans TaxID=2695856 RepID=A0A829YI27_9GAMM|nr:hypothetical protein [Steroidobacter agaridevorans]GFE82472.1 hypothetical protein GCM10011487_44720 [Steroidobacter agaridevorans]
MTMGLQQFVNDPEHASDAFEVAGLIKARLQKIAQSSVAGDLVSLRLAVLLLAYGLADAMSRSELDCDEALLVCACLEQARARIT